MLTAVPPAVPAAVAASAAPAPAITVEPELAVITVAPLVATIGAAAAPVLPAASTV